MLNKYIDKYPIEEDLYIEIDGHLHKLTRSPSVGRTYFVIGDNVLEYDMIRDGDTIKEDVAREKYPEYFI